jgi:hypothetical protein
MEFKSYEDYVGATLEYYTNKEFSNPSIMVLSEKDFNKFNGIIEFGAGSLSLTNKYNCGPKCQSKCNCSCKDHE